MRTSALRRTLSVAILALAALPGRALAHAHLRRSEPAADSRIGVAPRAIRLWFSEATEVALTSVVLTDAAGHALSLGAPLPETEGRDGVRVGIPTSLTAGWYTVAWRAVARDGHPSHGSFTFEVVASAGAAATTSPPATAVTQPAAITGHQAAPRDSVAEGDASTLSPVWVTARALTFVALLLVIGAVGFRTAVVNRAHSLDAPVRDTLATRTAMHAAVATLVLLVMSAARLWLERRMLGATAVAGSTSLTASLMDTAWAHAWRMQMWASLAALAGFLLAWKRFAIGWALAAVACIALAFATSLGGHAGAATDLRVLALAADTLHVLAAAAWLGSLLWLVVVGLRVRGTAILLVSAFSPLALGSSALVMLTGVISAWLRLGSLPNLWTTTYGQVLLLKLLLLAAVIGAGFYNWRRATPALGGEGAAERLTRSASTELAFALGVVVVTAVLVATPLPVT